MKKARINGLTAIPKEYFDGKKELGRGVRLQEDSRIFCWDQSLVSVSLTEAEREDPLYQVNAFTGKLPSSRVYPLLFDDDDFVRSFAFMRRVVEEGIGHLEALNDADRTLFNVGLRDAYIASAKGLLSNAETQLFAQVVALVDEKEPLLEVQGLLMSFYPTQTHKLARFIELDSSSENEGVLAEFAAGTKLVFVDPFEV